jgi:Tfp pilus assembly major pilin PilA
MAIWDGFTLMGLVAVAAVIGVLAAICRLRGCGSH